MAKQKHKPRSIASLARLLAAIPAKPVAVFLLVAMIGTAAGYGYYRLRLMVAKDLAFPDTQPMVVLKDRPAWMSDTLANRIAAAASPRGARSALDHQLLVDTAEILQYNPWVRKVNRVRRIFGKSPGDTIEIDCEYREPMALVAYRNEYILIDGQGFRLPEHYPAKTPPAIMFDSDGSLTLRIIEGVAAMPPYRDGQKWSGEDLQAGLDLVKLLYGKDFTNEIHRVNVANFNGRREPRKAHLSLFTKYGSEIAWGRPVRSMNFELPATKKLDRLAAIYRHFGQVDAKRSWLDIRNDALLQLAAEKDSLVRADGARPNPQAN